MYVSCGFSTVAILCKDTEGRNHSVYEWHCFEIWSCFVQMRVQVYVSFGGLLMQLTGDLQKLQELDVDANIYLLMRKVS